MVVAPDVVRPTVDLVVTVSKRVDAADTLEVIFTSIVLGLDPELVVLTPVIIPFRYPLNVEVVPDSDIVTFVRGIVTPIPTVAPIPVKSEVLIPMI